jgi:hypothetical protein
MTELNKDSKAACGKHGLCSPTFVCHHVAFGSGTGFNVPDESPDPDLPFKEAWCDDCDERLMHAGKWTAELEQFANLTMICEGCYEERRYMRAKALS